MTEIYKHVYEIDRLIIHQKFDQVREFLMVSKTFSSKIFGHLKILTHLVNNLVDSEDTLELVEQLLKIPELRNTTVKEDSTRETSESKKKTPENTSGFERVFENFL